MSASIEEQCAQSIKNIKDQMAVMEQSIAELARIIAAAKAEPSAAKVVKLVKVKGAEPKEKKPTAWNLLVSHTVAEMKQSGWTAFSDEAGTVWPASRRGPLKDGTEGFVYDGGENDGKAPNQATGGMVRASYLKRQSDPAAAAKKASAAGAPAAAPKKAGRPKMTDEQKAAAKAKRSAAKAKASAEPASDGESVHTCSDAATVAEKGNLSFYPFKYEGKSLIMNDRGDVVDPDEGLWVGRLVKGILDKTVPEPDDLDAVTMRE